MAHLDRVRAERLMAEAGLDALLLLSPESFTYATGVSPGVATMWSRSGAVAVLVPADSGQSETAVVSDLFASTFRRESQICDMRESPLWVETTVLVGGLSDLSPEEAIYRAWVAAGRAEDFERPTTFDPNICYRHIADALAERGLREGRIGYEATAVSMRDYHLLDAALAPATLVDATETIASLRMVKSLEEIACLRTAVEIAESGIDALKEKIVPGVSRDELAAAWHWAVRAHPESASLSGMWEYISVGSDPWVGNAVAATGDLVKVDVGCLVDGYTSDTGRTFVLGPPSELQSRLFDALLSGFHAGAALISPGVPLRDVHRAVRDAIRASGFPAYTRGHFGHGLGAGLGSEEWPFISSDASVVFEPGMVMALEAPWYIDGLGGMIVENQLLVTEDGHEMMNTLPLRLEAIAV